MTAVIVFTLASAIGVSALWTLRYFAPRLGLLDRPDGRRKIHARPIAVVGGLGIALSTIITVLLAGVLMPDLLGFDLFAHPFAPWLLLGACAITLLGFFDDVLNLRARYKLIGQIGASLIVILGGNCLIENISIFGMQIPLGYFSLAVTLAWFLAIINAVNLLDGMDGMLGSISIIVFISLGLMAHAQNNELTVLVAAATAGSLIGFLRFNFPPASVFLGDCGSLLLGMLMAALTVHAAVKGPAFTVMVPMALLILPIMDTSAAILRRKLTGRGLAMGDRAHLHHILQKQGLTVRRTLAVVVGLGVLASVGAVSSSWLENDLMAAAVACGIVLMLIAAGLFGTAEVRLVRERTRSMLRSATGQGSDFEMEVRLQGDADWPDVWQEITRRAASLNLDSVWLDVNAPAWHEGYHRRWQRSGMGNGELKGWKVELPLFGHGQVIGRLIVAGTRDMECIGEILRDLAAMVSRVEAVASEVAPPGVLAKRNSGTEHTPVDSQLATAT